MVQSGNLKRKKNILKYMKMRINLLKFVGCSKSRALEGNL